MLAVAIMVELLIYERFHNKVYRPYLIALPAYVGIYYLFIAVIHQEDWKAFWWMFFWETNYALCNPIAWLAHV